jgi:predicted acylesterase/phospholipase RssA
MKRALVLEGGGAKGAFSFGWLKALRDRGIVFDAVSGTSVGALKYCYLSTRKFDEGERLWAFLSYKELFTVRWPK